jgi:hypothetical protein
LRLSTFYYQIIFINEKWEVEEEGDIKVIQLGILTPENAEEFIRKALELEDKKDDLQETEIKQLAEQLQYFPWL